MRPDVRQNEQRQRSTSYGSALPQAGYANSPLSHHNDRRLAREMVMAARMDRAQYPKSQPMADTRPQQPKSLPLPNVLKSALGPAGLTSVAQSGERRERKSKKEALTSFCLHQIETCRQFDWYVQTYYTPLRTTGVISVQEVLKALDPICELAQMHKELLERLQRDSDMAAIDPYAKPQFCSFVHDTFAQMRGPFKIYMDNFDHM